MSFRPLGPVAQSALEAAIDAIVPAELPVCVGYPVGGLEAEHVYIVGDFTETVTSVISGGGQRDVAGELLVRLFVKQSTEEFSEPRDRALELEAYAEAAIAADPTLGGVVEEAHVSGVDGGEAIPDESSREYGLTITVAYTGTVTR